MAFFSNYLAPALIILLCLGVMTLLTLRRIRKLHVSNLDGEDNLDGEEVTTTTGNWEPNWIKNWDSRRD